MIPFDFDYYRPDTIKEALDLFQDLKSKDKKPIYYAGGTEFISMARMNNRYTEAVIDIKNIPECNVHKLEENKLSIGSAITLTQIEQLNLFPLLSLTVKRIADHTIQGKITLGGNLAGTIIYKEAALPLLLANSQIVLASPNGERSILINDIYSGKTEIYEDELIVQVIINKSFLSLPYLHVKRTKNEKIDYPLITLAAIRDNNKISMAISGLYDYPYRSDSMEEILNDNSILLDDKPKNIINSLPSNILNDLSSSLEYRKFMLSNIILDVLEKFKEEDEC